MRQETKPSADVTAGRCSVDRFVRTFWLFARLVWRRWEEPRPGWPAHYSCTYRLTISDAWGIARDIHWPKVRDDQQPEAK
jgi:hypothetical protein